MRRVALAFMLVSFAGAAQSQETAIMPRPGLVISTSSRVLPGRHALAPRAGDSAAIVVRGNDIVLDLSDVELVGTADAGRPDSGAGIAILVDGGTNITIRNGRIRGYRVAILARGTRNLRVLDNDLSHNWKPRLYSIVEHESLADWLSFHQNEKDEWMRFGAAIYLRDVKGGEIEGNTVRQGMNGLLMTRTDSLLVWNNDFSFNSGLGIGMYRSDHNRIMHNTVEFNVRGYSEGFYRRGQDSAGILIYEQSDSNTVAFNSATHSGDGLFLWAGQHTMDTGQGGANDNVIFGNDFSWAPTNGMEATFSRNVFIKNRVVGSDYGLWGGYSYSSLIAQNQFESNRIGIAIEHGQDNAIHDNWFRGESTAIHLWANPIEPGDWGYPKHRDTRSRDYSIAGNLLRARTALRVLQSTNVDARRNVVIADTLIVAGDTAAIQVDSVRLQIATTGGRLARRHEVKPLPGGAAVLPGPYANLPRSTIIVDEWGPYDWESPKLWPADSSLATPLRLRVLGPPGAGRWRLKHARGASISKPGGAVNDTIVVTPAPGAVEDWTITLEYRGQATRSPAGAESPANAPYDFSYSRFDPKLSWDVKVYAWTDSTHPLNATAAFDALLRGGRGAAALTQAASRLDHVWYRPRIPGWPQDKYGVAATTTVDLPPGSYRLRTISDDGIRVFVDDRLVFEDWSIHESRVHDVPLTAGRHRLRVEYFQRDGWAELRAEVVKR